MKNKTAKRAHKAHLRSFLKPWHPQATIVDLNQWLKSQTRHWMNYTEGLGEELEPKEVIIELTMPSYSAQLTMPDDTK